MEISSSRIQSFQGAVWDYYQTAGRHDLPWRQLRPDGTIDPYHVLVSELMLQQTQVSRVIPKYYEFLQAFPTISDLAVAELGAVLRLWSGLGYNRRAQFLWRASQAVMEHYQGAIPQTGTELMRLPGIGPNTAGAIQAYAFNRPVTFIETNIRTVFIHHFFAEQVSVADAQVLEIASRAVDTAYPREWYWALMDYGTHLKKTAGNASTRSKHYTKQSQFHGSRRQIRGQVLKQLTAGAQPLAALQFAVPDERLAAVVTELTLEGLIHERAGRLSL